MQLLLIEPPVIEGGLIFFVSGSDRSGKSQLIIKILISAILHKWMLKKFMPYFPFIIILTLGIP